MNFKFIVLFVGVLFACTTFGDAAIGEIGKLNRFEFVLREKTFFCDKFNQFTVFRSDQVMKDCPPCAENPQICQECCTETGYNDGVCYGTSCYCF